MHIQCLASFSASHGLSLLIVGVRKAGNEAKLANMRLIVLIRGADPRSQETLGHRYEASKEAEPCLSASPMLSSEFLICSMYLWSSK